MMRMRCGAGWVATLAWVALLAGVAGAEGPEWSVDPMPDGGAPVVTVDALEPGTEVTWTHTDAESGTEIGSGSLVAAGTSVNVSSWPGVARDTYVRSRFWAGAPGGREADFTWCTLLKPGGASLMGHRARGGFEPPQDFDAFWERAKAELAAVPMNAQAAELAWGETETGRLEEVVLDTVRGTRIVCRVTIPKAARDAQGNVVRRFPAVIVMPGYGAEQPPMDRTPDGLVTMSVNPRNHGPSRRYWTSPVEHLAFGIEDPEGYYYRLAFLDNLRATEYLLSRPEVDAERVAAEGGSQGGLFAIALAALEPRIRVVTSNVTAFSAIGDGQLLNQVGTTLGLKDRLAAPGPEAEAMRRSLAYVDGANMIRRVRVPVQVNMGGRDPVCHFVTGIATLNALPDGVPREFNLFPDAKHEVPGEMRAANGRWVQRWLGLETTPRPTGRILAPPPAE